MSSSKKHLGALPKAGNPNKAPRVTGIPTPPNTGDDIVTLDSPSLALIANGDVSWGLVESPACICGLENQTTTHLVRDCPVFIPERLVHLGKPKVDNIRELSYKNLLSFYMAIRERAEIVQQNTQV
jgi:hypothetical protein